MEAQGHDAIHEREGIVHPDFKDAYALMNAEVHELVKSVHYGDEAQQNVVEKTLQYVERFRKYKNLNAVTTIRSSLESKGMAQYEVASLANLCLSDVNEAKKLVPTLGDGRFEGEEEASLKQILDQIQNAQTME